MARKKRKAVGRSIEQQPVPQNLGQALLHVIWKWKTPWKIIILLTLGTLVVCFMLWNTLPESIKKDVLTYIWNRNSNSIQTSNSLSDESVNTNSDLPARAPQQPSARFPSGNTAINTRSANQSPALGHGNVLNELHAKGLLKKIVDARGYARGDSQAQDTALQNYRYVVEQLSPASRAKLHQGLLGGAEKDYREHNYTDALNKYQALFASYGNAGLQE